MQRRTSISRIGIVRSDSLGENTEWTIVFQLQWADMRHILPVRVPGPDMHDAIIQGWHAIASHLTDLAQHATREADGAETQVPKRQRLTKPIRIRLV